MKIRPMFICFSTWLFLAFILFSSVANAATEEDAKSITAMIIANYYGKFNPEFGAGIVVGCDNDSLFIVTANHLVRKKENKWSTAAQNVEIRLKNYKTKFAGQLLDVKDEDMDIAVIKISHIGDAGLDDDWFQNKIINGSNAVHGGDIVRKIGFANMVEWNVGSVNDKVISSERSMKFSSDEISAGYSGGGLFDKNWKLIGIVLRDLGGHVGSASRFSDVKEKLKTWSIPIGNHCEEKSTAQREYPSYLLTIDNINQLPPIPDTGDPDYMLIIKGNNGLEISSYIGESKIALGPIQSSLLNANRQLSFQIKEDDGIFGSETVTSIVKQYTTRLYKARNIRLPLDAEFVSSYPSVNMDPDFISFKFQIVPHFPDGKSGADKAPAGANQIVSGHILEDSISYAEGDATDYLKFNNARLIAIWSDASHRLNFKMIDSGVKVDKVYDNKNDIDNHTTLWLVSVAQPQPILLAKLFAQAPDGEATYSVIYLNANDYARNGSYKVLNAWLKNKFGFMSHFDENAALRLKKLRVALGVSPDMAMKSYWEALSEEKSKEKVISFLTDIFKYDYAELVKAKASCCGENKQHKYIFAIAEHEAGMHTDRQTLLKAVHSKNVEIAACAIDQIPDISPNEKGIEILQPFLLSEDFGIADHARSAILKIKKRLSNQQ